MKRFLLVAAALSVAVVSTPCFARAGGGHSYGGGIRSGGSYRAAPAVRYAPVYRAAPAARVYAPKVHFAHPRYVAPSLYRRPSVYRPIYAPRNPVYANPVRRVPERFVRLHGRTIGIPALAGLTAPAIIDVPDVGEMIVPQDIYTTIYPLLISEDQADQELAFTLLKERSESDPDSLVQQSAVSTPPMKDPCPGCQDDKVEVLHTCRPIGECDTSERLVNSSKNSKYLVPERGPDRRGLIF